MESNFSFILEGKGSSILSGQNRSGVTDKIKVRISYLRLIEFSKSTQQGTNTRRNSFEEFSCTDTLVPDSPENVLKDALDPQDFSDSGQPEKILRDDPVYSPSDNTQTKQPSETDQIRAIQRVSSAPGPDTPTEVDQRVSIPKETNENSIIVSQNLSGRPLQRFGTLTIQQIINLPPNNLAYGPKHHDVSLQADQFNSRTSGFTKDNEGNASLISSNGSDEGGTQSSERAFKSKYRFGFDEFSMNPFDKPDVEPAAGQNSHDVEKLQTWLKASPYRIWVTKYAASEPYAICKYDNCRHVFTLKGNPTSSNIIVHLKRNHRQDFELFHKKLKGVQPQLSECGGVCSIDEKPFEFRPELINFMCANELRINQLNLFIETIIPFSSADAPAFRKILECSSAGSHDYISSRKRLVSMMEKYEEQFNLRMGDTLRKSFNVNVLLDMWTSSNQKSYLAILVSFCPNLRRGIERLTIQDATANGTPNVHIVDFVDLSQERHTGNNLKEALLRSLGKLSIANKLSSVTVDSGSNNISMLEDLDNDIRGGLGIDAEKGVVKIRCMNHLLNRVFQDIMLGFEKSESSLLSKIDRLTVVLERNVFIKVR